MNKREVIISIKPTWCKLIANGEKVYEIRKRTLQIRSSIWNFIQIQRYTNAMAI